MAKNQMKFTVYQLDKIIISTLNCAFNKKYISNIAKLFSSFALSSYNTDYEKEVRVYLINKICKMILEDKIIQTVEILNNIDIDGKYNERATEILNELYNQELKTSEIEALDALITKNLKYSSIDNVSQDLIEVLTNIKTENYLDFEEEVKKAELLIGSIGKDLKSAKASIENQENEIDFSSAGSINRINELIERQANPSNKIKTGIIAFNEMLNGGFEAGQYNSAHCL